MKISIPEYVNKAIAVLTNNGFEAFVAGGAVRDALLGMCPDDWDITTNAPVEDVQRLFDRHFDTGIKHGTVTVLIDKKPIEITTYRIEGEYENNRRPKSVEFTTSLDEDLKRRDFTMNAMAYNDKTGLVDLFGGIEDLQKKIVRCVGDPDLRFNEDALRIMRAVRFSARLGFDIEQLTMESIKRSSPLLKNISAERIQTELVKTLTTGSDINVLFEAGIMGIIATEITEYNLDLINSVPSDTEIKLAALLCEADASAARSFINKLKFDNKTKNNTLSILRGIKEKIPADGVDMRKLLSLYGKDVLTKIIEIWKVLYSKDYDETKNLFEDNKDKPHTIDMLDINGNDLMDAGLTGTDIGRVMKLLLEYVINYPEKNSKSLLLKYVQQINNDNHY